MPVVELLAAEEDGRGRSLARDEGQATDRPGIDGEAIAGGRHGELRSGRSQPWTSFLVVPLFALANAGVNLRGGVFQAALASRVTALSGIGFTVALLIAALAAVLLGLRSAAHHEPPLEGADGELPGAAPVP